MNQESQGEVNEVLNECDNLFSRFDAVRKRRCGE